MDLVTRDLIQGIACARFRPMPIALALNVLAGTVLGATQAMLRPGCETDFPELAAATALRALGIEGREADKTATRQLAPLTNLPSSVFFEALRK